MGPEGSLAGVTEERARVALIGAGTMGAGIAQVALEAGWRVILHDPIAGATDRAKGRIRDGLLRRAAKISRDADNPDAWAAARLERLATAASASEAANDAHLVIEAAIEDLETKQRLFGELDRAAVP